MSWGKVTQAVVGTFDTVVGGAEVGDGWGVDGAGVDGAGAGASDGDNDATSSLHPARPNAMAEAAPTHRRFEEDIVVTPHHTCA